MNYIKYWKKIITSSWLSALSLSHTAIKNLLARSLLSTWSLLGPIFPYIWCHDLGRVSPLILVGSPFRLTPWPPWGHDWPGFILLIALACIQRRTFFGESTYPYWAPFAVSPFGVSGVSKHSPCLAISGWLRRQKDSLSCWAWIHFVMGLRDPSSKAWAQVTHSPRPFSPACLELNDDWFLRALCYCWGFVLREDAPQYVISSSPITGPGPTQWVPLHPLCCLTPHWDASSII
jgi:hypothetical protein